MSKIIDKIVKKENLLWAWKKAKRAYQIGDIWFNEIELTRFEINLNEELLKLKEEILNGEYKISTIKPIPFPKGYDNNSDNARTRQTFLFTVRDQVAWLAVVNIIGPDLDYKMPAWSYGNRLFISVWYDQDKINFGWYRNSHGNIYRKWGQSWPLYRRHVSLTTRIMAKSKDFNTNPRKVIEEVSEEQAEKRAFENNELTNNHLKVKYITKDYWDKGENVNELYWASIDLEKFYPKTRIKVIEANIKKFYLNNKADLKFENLIKELIHFKLDLSGWSKADLKHIQISNNIFEGIPTGLFVAGFLANVALLDVDFEVTRRLEQNKNIAHFRFVDDHVFVSYDFKKLTEWIIDYEQLLKSYNTGATVNVNKTEPEEFGLYMKCLKGKKNCSKKEKQAIKSTLLDPKFPSPLMTQTLAKVSAINSTEFDLLTENEENQLVADLEHLLITDFPDHELRKDTRISFAATTLSRLIPKRRKDYTGIYEIRKSIYDIKGKFKKEIKELDDETSKLLHNEINKAIHIDSGLYKIEKRLAARKNETVKEICKLIQLSKNKELIILHEIEDNNKKLKNHIFELILKAAKENHQKVRLWVRLVEYCSQTGYAPLYKIIDEIDDLNRNSISSDLSNSFLYSLFLNVVSDRILSSTSRIINSIYISEDETKAYIRFIEAVYNINLLKKIITKKEQEQKEYFQTSIEIFYKVISSLPNTIEKTKIDIDTKSMHKVLKKLNLIDKSIYNSSNNQENSGDINNWILWYFSKLQGANKTEVNKALYSILNIADKHNSSCVNIIKLAPDYDILSEIIDQDVLIMALSNITNEGWFFDLAYSMKDKKDTSQNLLNLIYSKHKKIKEHIEYIDEHTISVYEWLMGINILDDKKIKNSDLFFDPSLSEWTCLQIIIQIIELIKLERKNDFLKLLNFNLETPIHPSNFLVPTEWLDKKNKISWEKWRSTVKNNCIKQRAAELIIIDSRYTPESLVQYSDYTISVVYGLGILMISLLRKNARLPWIWNSEEQNFSLPNAYRSRLKEISVSSYTYAIIDACLNIKDKETFLWINKSMNNVQGFEASDDTLKETPQIRSLEELREYCSKACEILEKYQISVQNNMPRQLIPISLEQLSKINNPFGEKKESLS